MKTLVAASLFVLLATGSAQAKTTIVVVSDLPYNSDQHRVFREEIAPAIQALSPPVVIHLGDIRGGGELSCADPVLEARRDEIRDLMPDRVVYTPGDNDWTDCDRSSLSLPMAELDRLNRLTDLFLGPDGLSHDDLTMVSAPEDGVFNRHWRIDGIDFLTLHVVGTNNGRQYVELNDIEEAIARVEERDVQNFRWLEQAVGRATADQSAALVIGFQADVTDPWGSGPCTTENPSDCDPFAPYRDAFREAARTFGGPILVVHGDSSPYCLDRDFGDNDVPNLWRLNSAGDYAVVDAVTLEFDAEADVPFKAATLLGNEAPDDGC